VLLVIKLYAVWLLPNWLLKVLAVAEAIRRYRRRDEDDDRPV
jgi:hypothetical protein